MNFLLQVSDELFKVWCGLAIPFLNSILSVQTAMASAVLTVRTVEADGNIHYAEFPCRVASSSRS